MAKVAFGAALLLLCAAHSAVASSADVTGTGAAFIESFSRALLQKVNATAILSNVTAMIAPKNVTVVPMAKLPLVTPPTKPSTKCCRRKLLGFDSFSRSLLQTVNTTLANITVGSIAAKVNNITAMVGNITAPTVMLPVAKPTGRHL